MFLNTRLTYLLLIIPILARCQATENEAQKLLTTPPTKSPFDQADYLMLAIEWQPGFNFESKRPSEARFSIHGLWPTKLKKPFIKLSRPRRPKFSEGKLVDSREDLDQFWPSLNVNKWDSVKFWNYQWNKHGKLSKSLEGFGSVEAYFRISLELFDSLNLKDVKLVPSNEIPYGKNHLVSLLVGRNNPSTAVELKCKSKGGMNYLVEIRFCFSVTGANQLIDCPKPKDTCKANLIYLVEPHLESASFAQNTPSPGRSGISLNPIKVLKNIWEYFKLSQVSD